MPGVKPRYTGPEAGGRAGAVGVWVTAPAGISAVRSRAVRIEPMTQYTGPKTRKGPNARTRPRKQPLCPELADVLRLQALRTLGDFEFDRIALGETAEALSLDRREVDEHIGTRLLRDKAKALRVVEPLHLTLCHNRLNLSTKGHCPGHVRPWSPRPGTGSNKNRETSGPRGAQTNR